MSEELNQEELREVLDIVRHEGESKCSGYGELDPQEEKYVEFLVTIVRKLEAQLENMKGESNG